MQIVRKIILRTLIVAFTFSSLTACGGRQARPVSLYHSAEILTCKSLLSAMDNTQESIDYLIPQTNKVGKNIAIGVASFLFFLPGLFFLDFSDAEKIEIEAYRNRYNHLVHLYEDKNCTLDSEMPQMAEIPDFNGVYNKTLKKRA